MAFPYSAGLTALIALLLVHETCSTEYNDHCAPSSCGNIHNISSPFRLRSDPKTCGDSRYELSCENNHLLLYLFGGKYYVQEINYNNCTIRVVDSGMQTNNYISTSSYSLNGYKFSHYESGYGTYKPNPIPFEPQSELSRNVIFMSCENPVNSPLYLDTSTCVDNKDSGYSSNFSVSDSKRYRYVKDGRTNATDVEDSCKVEHIFLTSRPRNDDPKISCADVHYDLVYGFELSLSGDDCGIDSGVKSITCTMDESEQIHCRIGGKQCKKP